MCHSAFVVTCGRHACVVVTKTKTGRLEAASNEIRAQSNMFESLGGCISTKFGISVPK